MKKFILVAFISASLVGCASVKMGDAGKDAAVKTFAVPADKSALYLSLIHI